MRNSHGYVVQHLIDRVPTVSDLLGITRQAASKHLFELERPGCAPRGVGPRRQPSRRAQLTDRGWRLVDDSRRIRQQLDERLARTLPKRPG
ncbi:hypothetical protein [Amycolatopsis rubida]|uniref:hypothetical protein n=1 Tax=Amycolatopsis rubida TaxID=112413 RepID=UPI000A7CBE2F|nr:hypothetical protein [Amycolatopsis rubida]